MNNNSTFMLMTPSSYELECITWLTVIMVESVAIFILNVVTIIIFIKVRSHHRRSMYLVINLAVADMLVGGFSEVICFYYIGYDCDLWKNDVVGIWNSVLGYTRRDGMQMPFLVVSMTSIVAISLERMHATFFPLRHRVIRKRIYVVTIAILWILAAVVSASFSAYLVPGSLNSYLLHSSGCFALLTICISYASIAVKIHCGAHPQHHGATSRERKLTVTLFIVTLVSLLTWLPYVIWRLIEYTIIDYNFTNYIRIDGALVILYYANSLVNPILYAIRMPEFKRGLVSLFCCRPQQRQVVFPLRVM